MRGLTVSSANRTPSDSVFMIAGVSSGRGDTGFGGGVRVDNRLSVWFLRHRISGDSVGGGDTGFAGMFGRWGFSIEFHRRFSGF
ncbi:unnamed protein product [Eruca vesicaria subsp. sativa]|uniref:Uncharacterized protein n=1 Tax=Eruca vesicaria subsp. sativa TaxID=29727 RepID=A0ABC8L976_ERUVS|nr:unnamed protein product [Eruca vesicaria subsp. sativa]